MNDMEWDDSPQNQTNVREIAGYIDNDFFSEAIKEQIFDSLDCNTVDYLDSFKIKIDELKNKYDEDDLAEIFLFAENLYKYIIEWVEGRYEIEVDDYDDSDIPEVSSNMYKFFVIELKSVCESFLINYIIENYNSIINNIPEEVLDRSILSKVSTTAETKNKYLTVANIQKVIREICSTEFQFDTFLRYAANDADLKSIELDYEDGTIDVKFKIVEEGSLIQKILSQIYNEEFDRNMIINIIERLLNVFNINNNEDSIF